MKAWEVKTIDKTELKPKYDYGILLTGMITYDAKFERINFLRSNDRLLQTLDLYYDGIIDKIFIVGGSGELLNQKHREAEILQDYLLHIGVPPEDIIIETESKNTHENAVNAALILEPNENNDTYLLITSAFHMRRSIGCFKKAGFQDFDYYVANRFAGPIRFSPDHSLIPHASALEKWNLLIHEITGYVIYKIMGYA
ncbi:MAG: YdcF family protein, partial [Bacteroidales bacterium]|nr:YdcF family protein [Bacteroidales bacterium]